MIRMVMKTVAGYGAITYKNADGVLATGRYGEKIDVDPEDAKRLAKFGAFEATSDKAMEEADLIGDSVDEAKAATPRTRKG